jgi:hypothetical protein
MKSEDIAVIVIYPLLLQGQEIRGMGSGKHRVGHRGCELFVEQKGDVSGNRVRKQEARTLARREGPSL